MSDQPTSEDRTSDDEGPRQVPATVTADEDRVVVVTPDGMGVAPREAPSEQAAEDGRQRPTNPADLVAQPAKVMRIGSMVKQLLEEVRSAPLDEQGRARLADVHERSIAELKDGLAPELVEELERIALPFSEEAPSDAELRIAQAQLVGWLEGLFHGIQTALVAQQMAAQAQLQQMRQLPPGMMPGQPGHPGAGGPQPGAPGGRPAGPSTGPAEGTGQYL